jgi:hypothetical protein
MTKEILTQESLKELLHYSPESGVFTWLQAASVGTKPGSEAGGIDGKYLRIGISGKRYRAHRLAFLYMSGEMPPEVDHINHIGNDNRWDNLRPVHHLQNGRNQSKRKNNKSGFNGVSWCSGKGLWSAQIGINKKTIHLGFFKQKEDAIACRKKANAENSFHHNHGV